MHHRKPIRASRFDYSASAGYFVTICTKNRVNYFGEICRDDLLGRPQMKLNDLGKYCDTYIKNLHHQRKTIDVHEWVVMPNHIHILLHLAEFTKEMNINIQDTRCRGVLFEGPNSDIGQAKSLSLQHNLNYQGPKLWSVINMFKGAITKYASTHNISFARQSRYHDHIIRNEWEYKRITNYIQTNPQNWEKDSLS